MHTLRLQDRDMPMTNMVSYKLVPMHRGLAFALYHMNKHGAPVDIFSACRIDKVIAEHNEQFHTNLHGQQYLYDHQHEAGFNPANPPSQTSHCLHADSYVKAALAEFGVHVEVGGAIPWHALGLDLSDKGKSEDVSHFLSVAHHLGYEVVQPYKNAAQEKHHVIFVASPIPTLERWNVISKKRSSP